MEEDFCYNQISNIILSHDRINIVVHIVNIIAIIAIALVDSNVIRYFEIPLIHNITLERYYSHIIHVYFISALSFSTSSRFSD